MYWFSLHVHNVVSVVTARKKSAVMVDRELAEPWFHGVLTTRPNSLKVQWRSGRGEEAGTTSQCRDVALCIMVEDEVLLQTRRSAVASMLLHAPSHSFAVILLGDSQSDPCQQLLAAAGVKTRNTVHVRPACRGRAMADKCL